MTRGQSHYFDLLRTGAALAVFAVHASLERFTGPGLVLPDAVGHGAVIVFFVLSGFVIAHVARTRERDWRDFALSRAVRIYSVAVPAVVLTILVDTFLRQQGLTDWSRDYQLAGLPKYLPMFLLFLTDIWWFGEDALSNVPYWSLCYEVWYYVAFAGLFFARGPWRIALPLLVAALGGPRLVLLFPIWLLGWAVLAWQARVTPSPGLARGLLVVTALGIAALFGTGLYDQLAYWGHSWLDPWLGPLRKSSRFAGDWVLGLLVAVHFAAARHAALEFGRAARWIAAAASCSFTLYLTHYPLLGLWSELLGHRGWAVVPAVLGSVVLIGGLTEWQKDRLRRRLRHHLRLALGIAP